MCGEISDHTTVGFTEILYLVLHMHNVVYANTCNGIQADLLINQHA